MDTTTASRPVRIHLCMKDSPLRASIKQIMSSFSNESTHVFFETTGEADLVIFTDVRDIEQGYSAKKSYALIQLPNQAHRSLPDNCAIIDPGQVLVGLLTAIGNTRKKLQPVVDDAPPAKKDVPIRPDALRILVIDDMPENIASARKGLAGHALTTANGYAEAMVLLGAETFDVVLTDLHLPMSSQMMGDRFKLGELVPYGILLMIEAAHQGAKFVAVVTDLSHHDDPFSAAFDYFSTFPMQVAGARVLMMHAPMSGGVKDWAEALERIAMK